LNKYTKEQIQTALQIAGEVFKDNPNYWELSHRSKELFACALLRANELTKKLSL
jgi:hypothetical protein